MGRFRASAEQEASNAKSVASYATAEDPNIGLGDGFRQGQQPDTRVRQTVVTLKYQKPQAPLFGVGAGERSPASTVTTVLRQRSPSPLRPNPRVQIS